MISPLRRVLDPVRQRPAAVLRVALIGVGAVVALSALLGGLLGGGVGEQRLGLLAAGVIAIGAGAVRLLPAYAVAVVAVGLALYGYLVRMAAHAPVSFPAVDWIQPQTIDRGRPLPMLGVLLVLLAFRAATAHGGSVRGVTRGVAPRLLGLIGAGLLVYALLTPQHFAIEVIRPARAGTFAAPYVDGGQLGSREWSRSVIHGVPLTLLPRVVANEGTRARLAQGLHEDAGWTAVEAGTRAEGVALRHSGVRNALWTVQRAVEAVVVYAIAAIGGLALLLVIPWLAGIRLGRWTTLAAAVPLAVATWLAPAVDLGFHAVMIAGGLPDGRGDRMAALAATVGFAAVVAIVDLAGRVLGEPAARAGGEEASDGVERAR